MDLTGRQQSGGEKIGQGTYGCIFNPPLLCKGKKILRGPGDIGKVTSVRDAANELKFSNILRDRPLSANYFILPEADTCIIAPLQEQKDIEAAECEPFIRNDQPIRANERVQFKMKYGGISLYNYFSNLNINTFDFIGFIVHLLEGASLLAIAGVVHYDIYAANILVDKAEVPRFIDWGFAFQGASVTNESIGTEPGWKTLKGRQTNVEPPEITLATCMKMGYSLEEAINFLTRGKPILTTLRKNYFFSDERQRKQLDAFVRMSDSFAKKDWATMFRTHWSKFDSWSIGCVIYDMYISLIFSSEQFYENVYKPNEERLDKLLYAMLHLNPFVRADCLEALEILEPRNKILEKYGKKWLAARKEQRDKMGLKLGAD